MALRLEEITPGLLALMSPEDRAKFERPGSAPTQVTKTRTSRLEKKEQGDFSNECLRRGFAYVWHATHKPSTATPGTPDFIVAVGPYTLWIEFKRPGEALSDAQKDFRQRLEAQGQELHVVYSCLEAIALVNEAVVRVNKLDRSRADSEPSEVHRISAVELSPADSVRLDTCEGLDLV